VNYVQNYNPFGSGPVSTLIAALPVLTLFTVLLVWRKKVWISALSGLIMAFLLAFAVFGMPARIVLASAVNGFLFGFLQIAWIILASIFLYNLAVATGKFEIMKASIAAVSADRRIQVVLIGFCFSAFLEGTGGGGTPVAVAGSFLIGLGFPPFDAAFVCLLANTSPVAWGAVGSPIRILSGVTGLPESTLSAMNGRILTPFSLLLPAYLILVTMGWKRTREVLPAMAVAGASFAGSQFFWSHYMETGLVDIVSGTFSLLVMVAFLRFWQPRRIVRIQPESGSPRPGFSLSEILVAWSPFIIASLLIFLWGLPAVSGHLRAAGLIIDVPWLHMSVIRMPPIAAQATAEPAKIDLNLLAFPGTAVFAGAFLSLPFIGMSLPRALRLLGKTARELVPSLGAISLMVGLAFVTRFSGMDAILGLSLTRTGWIYPFFGTLLGWLGVGLTGTDGGSNALFGNLQKTTARQLGLNPILMASANSAGGVMGKMIAAQSLVIATTATGQTGKEADLFRALFKHSILLAALVGLLVLGYVYLFPMLVPGP
jgi:lactate permease